MFRRPSAVVATGREGHHGRPATREGSANAITVPNPRRLFAPYAPPGTRTVLGPTVRRPPTG